MEKKGRGLPGKRGEREYGFGESHKGKLQSTAFVVLGGKPMAFGGNLTAKEVQAALQSGFVGRMGLANMLAAAAE